MTRWVWIEDLRVVGEGCMGLIGYPNKFAKLTQIPCKVEVLPVRRLGFQSKEHSTGKRVHWVPVELQHREMNSLIFRVTYRKLLAVKRLWEAIPNSFWACKQRQLACVLNLWWRVWSRDFTWREPAHVSYVVQWRFFFFDNRALKFRGIVLAYASRVKVVSLGNKYRGRPILTVVKSMS